MTTILLSSLCLSIGLAFVAATFFAPAIAGDRFPMPSRDGRIGQIGGLRGFLALGVMAHHFTIWMQVVCFGEPWSRPSIDILENLGSGGVSLFFMTTGTLFYDKVRKGLFGNNWVRLYILRFFRIEPLVLLSLILVAAIALNRAPAGSAATSDFVGLLGWLSSFHEYDVFGLTGAGRINAYVLWSLTAEWIFYLALLPLSSLGATLMSSKLPTWMLPMVLLILALGCRLVLPGDAKYLALFPIGMLAREASQRAWCRRLLCSSVATLASIAALITGLAISSSPLDLVPMAMLAVFFTSVACGNDLFGCLSTRGATILGECSFGIYLMHGMVLSTAFTEGAAFWRGIPTALFPLILVVLVQVTVLITAYTYRYFELPILLVGKRLAGKVPGRGRVKLVPAFETAP